VIRFDWQVILADGSPEHPTEVCSVRVGFGDEPGVHIEGLGLVGEMDEGWWFEVDALALEGDPDLELAIPMTFVSSQKTAIAAVERALTEHNERQRRTIVVDAPHIVERPIQLLRRAHQDQMSLPI
jgi:hypothetical protein